MNDTERELLDRACVLEKENAELRECLKEALEDKCEVCKNSWYGSCVTKDGSPCSLVKKWRAALEGGNHAND